MADATVQIRHHEDAIQLLEMRIKQLQDRGEAVADGYWKHVKAMEPKLPGWESKSRLQVRCILTGNSIRADWCEVRWYGSSSKGGRRSVRRQITKPKDAYGYTLSKLLTLSPDWAEEIVKKTETQLTEIRREASHLVKAIIYIKHALTAANLTAKAHTTE
jgi:hypothetical protein